MKLQTNTLARLGELSGPEVAATKQGQAAQFTLAYEYLWLGVQNLGDANNAEKGVGLVLKADEIFTALTETCKNEPDRLAEASYNLAVCKETFAVLQPESLEEAKKAYEELAKGPLAKTAHGVMATRRMEQFNNPAQYAQILTFYKEFKTRTKFSMPQ